MVTDVKKAIFRALMSSDDYLHAYEQLMHLNLKKTQQREIVRVLLQCCLQEEAYNPFYGFLSQKLLADPNYKYTFKYVLWDYLKSLERQEVRAIANLAEVFAELIAKKLVPLHFLKVVDFEQVDKPNTMFMQLLLSGVFEKSPDAATIDSVFRTGFLMTHAEKEEGVEKFIKGFSGFVLGKFYLRVKR